MSKAMKDGTWNSKNVYSRNKFISFSGRGQNGMKEFAFDLNPTGSDLLPPTWWHDNEFIDVADSAFGHFYDPKPKWANLKDCGAFPCTAPWNTVNYFKGTKFEGIKPLWAKSRFQLIADNPGFAPYVPNCERLEENNMWTCQQSKISLLMFESLDPDRRDRGMAPVYVS